MGTQLVFSKRLNSCIGCHIGTPAYNRKPNQHLEVHMESYRNFIGIDIGKNSFVVNVHGKKVVKEYDNNPKGIKAFIKEKRSILKNAFTTLEATGGYEMKLLLALCEEAFPVHRANTRKVKHFIMSLSNGAKTDPLDAQALAGYGFERHKRLTLFIPSTEKAVQLYELVQRRTALKEMLTKEKNRKQAPKVDLVKSNIEAVMKALNEAVDEIDQLINDLIAADEVYAKKEKILISVPGIGKITAAQLLGIMPELGTMSSKEASSLAGLAPRANESGKFKGYRKTAPGRNIIKARMYTGAMAACRSHSRLGDFYKRLIAKGKRKKVAQIAVMRKMVVIANARLKEAFMTSDLATVSLKND